MLGLDVTTAALHSLFIFYFGASHHQGGGNNTEIVNERVIVIFMMMAGCCLPFYFIARPQSLLSELETELKYHDDDGN